MDRGIVIRQLIDMPDLNATVELQKAVWRMHDVEVGSPHTLRAIAHSGGAVIGAIAGRRLVGFCFGFGTLRDGEPWLWSHMAGVHPGFQRRGIGFRLKQAQRQWALAQGYRLMAWTFDPMQCGNANFNFNRLGVTARRYSADHYGEMQDGINAGLASDRLEAQWELDAPHVVALAAGKHLPPSPGPSPPHKEGRGGNMPANAAKLVYVDEEGTVCRVPPAMGAGTQYSIEIPANIAALKQGDMARAGQWQLHLREAMMELLAAEYVVSGFVRAGDRGWYVLSRVR